MTEPATCQCDPTFTPSPERQRACFCEVCSPLGLTLDPATWRTLSSGANYGSPHNGHVASDGAMPNPSYQ